MKRLFLIAALVLCFVLSGRYSFANEAKVVFGPQTYTRTTGGPNTFSGNFDVCDPTGTFTITVNNGDANGNNRVSSGTISINGLAVVQQSDFNQNVATITKPVYGIGKTGNIINVKLQSDPGSEITVTVSGVMHCLEVHITSPANGSTMSDYSSIIRGTVDDQPGAEIGVTVNGIPAEVNGKNFAVLDVPLQVGQNTITANAVDDSGETAQDISNVTLLNPPTNPVYLTATPAEGQVPLSVSFSVDDTIPAAKTLYEMDYGDGTAGASAQTAFGLFSSAHVYNTNGLYFPTITITDANGNTYTKTAMVNVAPMPDLKAKWNNMKSDLAAGDITDALNYITLAARSTYQRQFKALANGGILGLAAGDMGNVNINTIMQDVAEGDMQITVNGTVYSFAVTFIKDDDGIWRIQSF